MAKDARKQSLVAPPAWKSRVKATFRTRLREAVDSICRQHRKDFTDFCDNYALKRSERSSQIFFVLQFLGFEYDPVENAATETAQRTWSSWESTEGKEKGDNLPLLHTIAKLVTDLRESGADFQLSIDWLAGLTKERRPTYITDDIVEAQNYRVGREADADDLTLLCGSIPSPHWWNDKYLAFHAATRTERYHLSAEDGVLFWRALTERRDRLVRRLGISDRNLHRFHEIFSLPSLSQELHDFCDFEERCLPARLRFPNVDAAVYEKIAEAKPSVCQRCDRDTTLREFIDYMKLADQRFRDHVPEYSLRYINQSLSEHLEFFMPWSPEVAITNHVKLGGTRLQSFYAFVRNEERVRKIRNRFEDYCKELKREENGGLSPFSLESVSATAELIASARHCR